jgi:hypothetical protein
MGGRWTVGEAEGGGAIERAEESGGEKSRCGERRSSVEEEANTGRAISLAG